MILGQLYRRDEKYFELEASLTVPPSPLALSTKLIYSYLIQIINTYRSKTTSISFRMTLLYVRRHLLVFIFRQHCFIVIQENLFDSFYVIFMF